MPHKPLTHREAVEVAKRFAASERLPFRDGDLDVRMKEGLWQVSTNSSRLGGNLVVQLDPVTGLVKHHVYYWE
jgi:hypothetical protein